MILMVLSPLLTGIMLAVVPVVVIGAVVYGKFLQKVSKKYQKSLSKGGEVLGCMRDVVMNSWLLIG